jgi:Uma2 family endonuclease
MEAKHAYLSPEEYLEQEAGRAIKHEYVDGQTYAMTGASRRHNLLFSTLFRHAANAAVARNCHVFGPDMMLRVAARNCFYYPDLSVSCDPEDRDERFLTRPCAVIEILSPSTGAVDRREKRSSYATLPSLLEYLIVDQDRMRVDVYTRDGESWSAELLTLPDDIVEISCLQLRLALRDIYADIDFSRVIAEPEPPEYTPVYLS